MTHSKHTLNIFALVMPSRIETVTKQVKRQTDKVKSLKRQLEEADAKAVGLSAELKALSSSYQQDLPVLQMQG